MTGTLSVNASNDVIAENAFKKLYVPYSGIPSDPIEIREYYNSYKDGNYKKVISATDEDYQLMGGNERNKLLKQYMQLYQGLAWLAEDNSVNAIQMFNDVLQSSVKTTHPYYTAQWYSTLAWLKEGNISKATIIAKNIESSASPYSLQEKHLSEQLKLK